MVSSSKKRDARRPESQGNKAKRISAEDARISAFYGSSDEASN